MISDPMSVTVLARKIFPVTYGSVLVGKSMKIMLFGKLIRLQRLQKAVGNFFWHKTPVDSVGSGQILSEKLSIKKYNGILKKIFFDKKNFLGKI